MSEVLGLTPTCICRFYMEQVGFPVPLKRATQIGENSLSSSVTLTKIAVFLQSKICMTSGSNYSFKNHFCESTLKMHSVLKMKTNKH